MADEFNASFTEGGIIHGGGNTPTPSGETGADGKSAYEIAVENGFDGTVTEWLESLKGEKGERGEQGIKGDKGDKGADGSQGIQGIQGERGEKGETGEKGAAGKDGLNGKDGVNGADGKSAYELAVANGYTGTLAEWLNSLKGSDGKDGKDGAKGDKGDKGDIGAQGLKGEKGDSGVEQQIVINSAVTSYTIKPNILYVFPELAQLDVSFDLTDLNPNIVNDFHFQFTNGSTPCELNLPESVNIGDYEPQANGVCEISIVNGLLSYQNWSVVE